MKRIILTLFLVMPFISSHAADKGIEEIKTVLARYLQGSPDSIKPAPIPGMYAAAYGTDLVYITNDGRYLLSGSFFDLEKGTNLTEEHRSRVRGEILSSLDKESMITYKSKGETTHSIIVFTDIDCVYCRRLHQGMDEMNDLGIEVRYMAFPRAGIGSGSYQKAVNVWCADDRNAAMTRAKNNQSVKKSDCETPIAEHYQTGQQLGVNATPTILLANGKILPGYVPPKKLKQLLDQEAR